ncbi:MAG TPA: DUF1700 domain-containing protein [Clostridia bacterium]|nr:DUF1700 domain-containing protein [Clostridia bacterium]
MDERLKTFLEELKVQLAGLPELEKMEALDYYTEYVSDAVDEGVSPDEILSRLDSPEKIAAMIKAETSIRKAQSNPGLKNYSSVVKYARFSITRPISIFLFSIIIFCTYSIAFSLFLVTIAAAAGACLVFAACTYEALRMPFTYITGIISTIGIGIFLSGVLILTAYLFFILCRLFIRMSTGLIARMLRKPGRSFPEFNEDAYEKKANKSRALKAGLFIITAGLIISLSTGLPIKLFMIFNSMKPANVTMREWSYNAADIRDISMNTAHSHIRLEEGKSDKIEVSYEQSDWMDPEISDKDGKLSFKEKFNGRIPFFPLISMHENNAELTIRLPAGYNAEVISLESRGGFIWVDSANYPAEVRTYTGSIYLKPGVGEPTPSVKAVTSTGTIQVSEKDAGKKTANKTVYENVPSAGSKSIMDLETDRGSIFID